MTTLSYASGISDEPLMGMTIGEKFDETVLRYPHHEALVVPHQNIRWTYQDVQQEVDICAKALLSLGIERGDRIGIWSPNRAEWYVLQFASAKVGAVLVNINPSYRIHEVEYALNQSECVLLVVADRFKSSNYTEMIQELAPELPLATMFDLESKRLPHLATVVSLAESPPEGMISWEEFMDREHAMGPAEVEERMATLSFDDPINIQYTSGTTGQPKGATLSHHNILNNAYFTLKTMKFTDQDRLVVPLPLYHCFGMVLGNLGCVTHGATVIYPSEGFDALTVLQAVEKEKATVLYGVPTMYIAELEHPQFHEFDLTSLRTGLMAGSPCPVDVMKKVHSLMHMKDVQIAYGMTETSPVGTQTQIGTPFDLQVGSVGTVHPHLEIKIIDPETGQVVPLGETGEFCTRGYSIMLGYWNNPEQTAKAIDKRGWMHSEDLATMDENGYVKIVGRIKDMIIRGGENIYPKEIEEFLSTHPAVSHAQVIGVPDEKFGEAVCAWVQFKNNEQVSIDELRDYCKTNIAYFKVPKYFRITDEFPLTVTGKVRKVDMRKISIQELELDAIQTIQTA